MQDMDKSSEDHLYDTARGTNEPEVDSVEEEKMREAEADKRAELEEAEREELVTLNGLRKSRRQVKEPVHGWKGFVRGKKGKKKNKATW